jgi:hypothetical protein
VHSGDVSNRFPGIPRFRPLQGQIKLLNLVWHTSARARRSDRCAACERKIKPEQSAVHLHGELYHSDCAL